LPAEPALAAELGVSRSTLREALNVLQREGLIVRKQRSGTVVTARPIVHHSLECASEVREMIEASGRTPGVRNATIRFMPASDELAAELEVEPGTSLTVLDRIHTADGEPVALTVDCLESRRVERATSPLLPEVSFHDWLSRGCNTAVAYGVARVSAIAAEGWLALRLGITPGSPTFHLRQTDYTRDGSPILHSREYYVQDAIEITVVRGSQGLD
jgi:GntR family transcriptional regulator